MTVQKKNVRSFDYLIKDATSTCLYEILSKIMEIEFRNYISGWEISTGWKVSKYEASSGPYFPGLRTEKYGPEKIPYLDTFQAVVISRALRYVYTFIRIFNMLIENSIQHHRNWILELHFKMRNVMKDFVISRVLCYV